MQNWVRLRMMLLRIKGTRFAHNNNNNNNNNNKNFSLITN